MLLSPSDASSGEPTVDVLMTQRPITIAPYQTIEAAAAVMNTCRIRHLPVVDSSLVGILSLRDVVAASDRSAVADAMTPNPHVIDSSTPLPTACEHMLKLQVSCLPVVDSGQLRGLITATDALAYAVSVLEAELRSSDRAPTVAQLMTARPLVVTDPSETLSAVWAKMRAARIRHLPVIHDESIVGLLSDRDLLAAGRDWLGDSSSGKQRVILVADAMSHRLATVDADTPALDAARTLLHRRFGALPVMRGRDLRGILTVSDFLYWILARA